MHRTPRQTKGSTRLFFLCLLAVCLFVMQMGQDTATAAEQRMIFAGGTQVVVIDHSSMTIVAQIPVGKTVRAMVADRERPSLYAAHSGGVEVFDTRIYQSQGLLTTDPASAVTLSRDGKMLYVLSHPVHRTSDGQRIVGDYSIEVVDLGSRDVKYTILLGPGVLDAAVDETGGRVYALRRHGRSLDVFGLSDGRRLSPVVVTAEQDPMKLNELFAVAVDSDGRYIYVPQLGALASIHMVDTTGAASGHISLGGEVYTRDLAVAPDGSMLYLLTTEELLAIDTKNRRVKNSVLLDQVFFSLDLSPDGENIFLCNPVHEDGGSMRVYDSMSLKLRGNVTTPGLSVFTAAGTNPPAGH